MKRINIGVLVSLVALLSGCVILEGREPFVLRVIEYGAQAGAGVTAGQVGGCSIHQAESPASAAGKGSTSFVLVYQGEHCAATVTTK